MAHVRVHPKFLHSNATSHKWALGAVAELLDNALDEVQNGATFVSIDMELNPRAAMGVEPMLVVEGESPSPAPIVQGSTCLCRNMVSCSFWRPWSKVAPLKSWLGWMNDLAKNTEACDDPEDFCNHPQPADWLFTYRSGLRMGA